MLTKNIAKHFREIYFGGNWTASNLKDILKDVNHEEAVANIGNLNTIATLVYHIHYYVRSVTQVLTGGILDSKDELSFSHPKIESAEDWQKFKDSVFLEGESFAQLIEQLPDEEMWKDFVDPKYGIYYRNLSGIIEHTHYHTGQIAVIKKLLRSNSN